MKTGNYKVSFDVTLTNPASPEEATASVMAMVKQMFENEEDLEVNFELIDGVDQEYTVEEQEVQELNF